jgi:hypothetical protein
MQQFRAELEAQGIDLEELIHGNPDLIQDNAQQLAEALLAYWHTYVTANDKHTIRRILARNGSLALQDMTDMFQKLFKKLGLTQKIAEEIRCYVDGHHMTDLPYDIVADISAEMLNTCIHTVGMKYVDQSKLQGELVSDQGNHAMENSVAELFTKIENWTNLLQTRPEEMQSLPSYRDYLTWYNRLKAGFVSVCDIPNYDVIANERLGHIINKLQLLNT